MAFAEVTLESVSNQFLNVHGADWEGLALTEEDWEMIRSLHEQIIEQPKVLEELYPEPGMIGYLRPIAIHSYGKLIGEGEIPLDQTSKDLLVTLSSDLSQGKNQYVGETLEALALTNSPWGIKQMRGLVSDHNPKLNEAVFKELANVAQRFENNSQPVDNLDTKYEISTIDYRFNSKEWKEEIYHIRKLSSDYLKKNPKLKAKPYFTKLIKNSHQAAKLVDKELKNETLKTDDIQKRVQNLLINTNLGGESDNPNFRKIAQASEQNESSHFWLYLIVGIILFSFFFFIIKRKSSK